MSSCLFYPVYCHSLLDRTSESFCGTRDVVSSSTDSMSYDGKNLEIDLVETLIYRGAHTEAPLQMCSYFLSFDLKIGHCINLKICGNNSENLGFLYNTYFKEK